jgi:hypothetical protein
VGLNPESSDLETLAMTIQPQSFTALPSDGQPVVKMSVTQSDEETLHMYAAHRTKRDWTSLSLLTKSRALFKYILEFKKLF